MEELPCLGLGELLGFKERAFEEVLVQTSDVESKRLRAGLGRTRNLCLARTGA